MIMKKTGLNLIINTLRGSLVCWARSYNKEHDVAVFSNEYVGRMVIIHGLYEKEYLENTSSILSQLIGDDSYKNGVCLDVGSNIGNHALYYSRIFRKIIAFEPNPIACKLIEASLLKNKIGNVELISSAVGTENKKQKLYVYDSNLGGASLNLKEGVSKDEYLEVDVCVGDMAVKRSTEHNDKIPFIKIDVEGFEAEAIKGLRDTIQRHKPVIAIELTLKTNNKASLKAIKALRELGYRYFYILSRKRKFSNKYVDFMFRILFGEEVILQKTSELDSGKNYLQVFCSVRDVEQI